MFFLCGMLSIHNLFAQEQVTALPGISGKTSVGNTAQKPTALSLPFFEDFTENGTSPSHILWKDHNVYLSNTMSGAQFSRGMAVFDANNSATVPYDTLNPFHLVWADSLSSQDIDLSSYAPGDSLWLSFYYEPGGNGFLPKPEDSFLLYFYNSNQQWIRVWQTGGDTAQKFTRVMVAVKDTGFFHAQFAFRFINKATHGISNSNWNVDYIYLNQQRNHLDTAINDIAFTIDPGNLLNDFTAMPFNQFKTSPSRFIADSIHAYLRNNGNLAPSLQYGYSASELLTGTPFQSSSATSSFSANQTRQIKFPIFSFSNFNPPASSEDKAIIQTKYFTAPAYPNESVINDTIIGNQIFDHYFAYDDGSAEKAYFLHLFPNAPGTTAIEYALYQPDTLRGVSIYFPRTVPPSNFKEFSLIVYKSIAINGGTDQILYQQDYYLPEFQDSINKFFTYRFDHPVAMDTGVYYVGVMQSAGGFSDSLYMGLDVNRKNGNHRYYNVDGLWQPSTIEGALMVRPVVGPALPPTKITNNIATSPIWKIYPNPATDELFLRSSDAFQGAAFQISDLQGRKLLHGKITKPLQSINIQPLTTGIYFIQIVSDKGEKSVQKFIRK